MDKLVSFVKLDFMTVKPYFTVRNLSLFAIIALFISAVSGNFSVGVGLGMMLAINFISYPFAIGEKSNMDALYTTLSADRKLVVLGRYVFSLALNLCSIVFYIAVGAAGTIAAGIIGVKTNVGNPFTIILMVFTFAIVIQSVQLPIYFKMGYAKAKFFAMAPYIIIMTVFVVITAMANARNASTVISDNDLEKAMAYAPFWALALIPVAYVSFRMSSAFYKKREF